MEVKLIKLHKKWEGHFTVGNVYFLSKNGSLKSDKDGLQYCVKEMCKSFSNRCSYSDILEKL
jgi:hypothetical protein